MASLRSVCVGITITLLAGAAPLDAQVADGTAPSALPQADRHARFLKQYCVGCHNQRLRTQGLALDDVDLRQVVPNAAIWEKVVRKLRTDAMPPAGAKRPDRQASESFAAWLESEIDRAAAATPNPGRTETWHRLNRSEYTNAIRDLLAVDIDVSSLLPGDDASYGFDNIAGVLKISPTLLDRYLAAARAIAGAAVGTTAVPPTAESFRVRSDFSQRERVEGLPLGTRGGTVLRHLFPLDAEYEFRFDLTGTNSADLHALEVLIDGAPVKSFPVGRDPATGASVVSPDGLTVRLAISAGPHAVAAAFRAKTAARGDGLYRPFLRTEAAGMPALQGITVTGPFNATGVRETPSRRRIFVCQPVSAREEAPCARRILETLARRAYRRPVATADLDFLQRFYDEGRRDGDFASGIEAALRRLLVSPEFLFRIERDPAGNADVYRISDLELASRLSFFLWSSGPDDELIDAAAKGTLRDVSVLRAQVRRMLKDPRASALTRNFAGQWLYLRNLPATTPDEARFPYFGENLRQDFQKETELFFETLLREDRSVMDVVTADFTFVNERLAKHYGIPNVYGSRFRRVRLERPERRGLLGQGSFLTVTSHPDRTSVVGRGKWILENLLGSPPPPPPPNVPALKEENGSGPVLTLRERMAQHRANPVCASCHARMDPLGFALENFDATGQWRSHEGFQTIDASAALPNGTTFDGPAGLRDWLLAQRAQVVTTVTEKLLTYALGRGVEYFDAPAIRKIVTDAAARDYRLTALITGIVESAPFQMRRRGITPAPASTGSAASSGPASSLPGRTREPQVIRAEESAGRRATP